MRWILMLVVMLPMAAVAGCVGNEEVSAPFGSAVARVDNTPVLKIDLAGLPDMPNLTSLSLSFGIGEVKQWAWAVDGGSGGLGNESDPTIVPAAMNALAVEATTQPTPSPTP